MTETVAVARSQAWSLPEQFMVLGMGDLWDRRAEGEVAGRGAALAAAMLLELLRLGHLRVQRDRFEVVGVPEDPALAAVAAEVGRHAADPTVEALAWLASRVPRLLGPWKDRLASRGVLEHRSWKAAGLVPRSEARILDIAPRVRLQDRLTRFLAGGGTADTPTILLLGLLEASGTLERFLPAPTLAFNRKRVQGLLTGRDAMGYRVDPAFRAVQDTGVHAILGDLRSARGLPLG